ncbi:hypothetical protein IQ241_17935 [Romeria aff. gracilis LEGE 07310]|uniref:Uncharacterized protein n=1 Tax=Vasconcelosia minhoensis LEGE 07310 TaxID=915328 RepID=A0A8J7A8K9_9CYAN|nr:hypothetical protein [Romeria gracilis]MBE9079157.1 hypothetical protein [Romeria aff. gracilis LEGE 07310]
MAKGFGTQTDQQFGYVLDLMPAVNAYAAKLSLDFRGEEGPFIGITSELEEAQVWKNIRQAKQAMEAYYGDFILDQLEQSPEVRVSLKRLKRSASGSLKTEIVETLLAVRNPQSK